MRRNDWLTSTAANVAIGVIGIVTSSIVARVLGPDGRGSLAESMLWPGLVLTGGAVVNVQTVVYFWARGREEGRVERAMGAAITLTILLTLTLVPLSLLINWIVLGSRHRESFAAANLFTFSIPLNLISASVNSVFLAEERVATYWSLRLVNSFLYVVLLAVLAVADWATVYTCVGAVLGAMAAAALVGIWLYLQSPRGRPVWDVAVFRAFTSFGTKTMLAGLPYSLNVRLDQLLMSILLPPRILGYYAAAFGWSSVLLILSGGLSTVMLSRSAATDPDDVTRVRDLIARFRQICVLLLGIGVAAAIVTPLAITVLFGKAFAPSIIPGMLLCLAAIVLSANLVLHELTRGLGAPELGVRAEFMSLGLTVVMLTVLLPLWGIIGAALASLVSYSVVFIALVFLLAKRLRVPMREIMTVRQSDIQHLRALPGQLLGGIGGRNPADALP